MKKKKKKTATPKVGIEMQAAFKETPRIHVSVISFKPACPL
jgi:hypothetical protein